MEDVKCIQNWSSFVKTSLFSLNTVLGTLNIIQRLAANNPVVAIISVLLIKMRLVILEFNIVET